MLYNSSEHFSNIRKADGSNLSSLLLKFKFKFYPQKALLPAVVPIPNKPIPRSK